MKRFLTVALSLVAACTLLVSALCVGSLGVSAAVTGTFVDEIVDYFDIPEVVDYSFYNDGMGGLHRIAWEYNIDLGATLMLKAAEPRDPGHTEYITYKMAKNIAGFELKVMCCAGLGHPLEDISVYISKTGADGTWAQVKTQATRYTYNSDVYATFDKAYWHESTVMNAQKIPTGYKYLKVQLNPCTGKNDVPWNVAIDTVTITMGSNVAAPVIPDDQKFLTYDEMAGLPSTDPTTNSTTESTTGSTTTSTTEPTLPPLTTYGDVNADGKLNVHDLGVLQQYINGWNVAINTEVADVNDDGKLNVRDLAYFQRYLNGWDVELKPLPTEPTTPPTQPTEPSKPESILTEEERALYQNVVDTENAWLASMQLPNGALPMTYAKNGTLKICPYFSDFAALSLLNQADLYADTVKKYMDWHFSHLNTAATDYNGVDGTIYDYHVVVSNGNVVREEYINGTPSYDSTDSYAATFLEVLQKYVEKTGDKAYIIAHKAEIERIVNALYSTMVNGLTLAKPDYAIKYLMDNCEVYQGMVKAAQLYTDVLVPADASLAATRDKLVADAALVAEKIETKMWSGSYYHPALGRDDGVAYEFNWSNYYPSATAQTFPIMFGLIDPSSERAQSLYKHFCNAYKWEEFAHPDTFYWGSNALTAAMMGDTVRVKTYMETYARIAMRSHAYPLYNADAAKTCMAAYLMLQM